MLFGCQFFSRSNKHALLVQRSAIKHDQKEVPKRSAIIPINVIRMHQLNYLGWISILKQWAYCHTTLSSKMYFKLKRYHGNCEHGENLYEKLKKDTNSSSKITII